MHVETITTASLGNRGYLVHDGAKAVAIDVQRDYQRWLERAAALNLTISHVLETHMHNDYLTGGFRLAEKTGAVYVVPSGSGQSFPAEEVLDNQTFETGKMTVRALHTPGHTPSHMSYEIKTESLAAIFTGGGILYGTVGRPDLISKATTQPLAVAQYDSAQKLRAEIPLEAQVFPTHGFGSFCSSAKGSGADSSTLAEETRSNIVFTKSKEDFVATILGGLSAYPRYYSHMGKLNQDGPDDMQLKTITKLTPEALSGLLANGEWVIDVRKRTVFAAHHPAGAVGFELADSFSSYLGWIIPWGDNLTLIGADPAELESAQLQLGRIGMDHFVSAVTDNIDAYESAGQNQSYPVVTFTDLAAHRDEDNVEVLDVRTPSEWQESHVSGAIHVPLYDLLDRLDELTSDKTYWVHCGSGYRASIAASLLNRSLRRVILIDDIYDNVAAAGLVLE